MTKDQYLGFQRGPKPEQSDQRQPDQTASFSHKAEALRDSASDASRIRFPTGVGSPIYILPLDPNQRAPMFRVHVLLFTDEVRDEVRCNIEERRRDGTSRRSAGEI